MSSGTVLVPGFMMNPASQRAFHAAGFELDFALSEEERSHGRWAFERAAERRGITQQALPEGRAAARVPLSRLVLGSGFDAVDLLAYTVGLGLSAALVAALGGRQASQPHGV